ncbi:Hypothetical predicted protein [Lynx pardinus]|uniref:Uncharacterized protein n=1 Tax=Lynx pardinus TaxID=191816 RepID=A0A485NF19_LYNPA|nr:Hypothetical predicted protein [Lynx pardinus]
MDCGNRREGIHRCPRKGWDDSRWGVKDEKARTLLVNKKEAFLEEGDVKVLSFPAVKVIMFSWRNFLPVDARIKRENATSWSLREHQGGANRSHCDQSANGTGRCSLVPLPFAR